MSNSFNTRCSFQVNGKTYDYYDLPKLKEQGLDVTRLPYSLKILLENLLRHEDGESITAGDIKALASWNAKEGLSQEIAYTPARVILQDFTGVPAVVDLAAMRDAMQALNADPSKINPLQPSELVIDHSVQVDTYGSAESVKLNTDIEYLRNQERYTFLRWGQESFSNFKVVPPGAGIVHQVNLEYLARVVFTSEDNPMEKVTGNPLAYPDTLVGTDSHTTMINGLGVLGWGVGGIEAEAAMLGQPVSMLIPQVIGFRLAGKLKEGATATDLVLTVTERLREYGVVGKFVEFFGTGLKELTLADRATLSNMSPEFGSTCAIFPVDKETLNYLALTGRSAERLALIETYARQQGLFHTDDSPEANYTDVIELDLSQVEPCLSGPKRPQDRIRLSEAKTSFTSALKDLSKNGAVPAQDKLGHGSVVIAAITSCTNTSNPAVMLAAGLLAKKAVEKGLKTPDWVKTSLAPGSRVVTEYLEKSGLDTYLEKLGFYTVGYGCTTCIGNSGPLSDTITKSIQENKLVVCSVLSGNRNFEGRIHPEVKANYLMSPPLVVAYALAGSMDLDLANESLGEDAQGKPVYLKDIWPSQAEIKAAMTQSVDATMFAESYSSVLKGDDQWNSLKVPVGQGYAWQADSTYIKLPPYFEGLTAKAPESVSDIQGARVLALLGDSVTTDHISPAGAIKLDSPAGVYLQAHGVAPKDFNSYGSRRGNHEIMMRGTFANVRLKNLLVPGTEGGVTLYHPTGETMSIFDASVAYQKSQTPLVILAGKEYGSGSSRDWAAKGPRLLGVNAVIAESYERIHRSNLIGMGIAPLQFLEGQSAKTQGLSGKEIISIHGLSEWIKSGSFDQRNLEVEVQDEQGATKRFNAIIRIDTPQEKHYLRHGGILQFVLRQLLER